MQITSAKYQQTELNIQINVTSSQTKSCEAGLEQSTQTNQWGTDTSERKRKRYKIFSTHLEGIFDKIQPLLMMQTV